MEEINDFLSKNKMDLKNDNFPEIYKCKICANVIEKAKSTKCGHVFCGRCIMEHLTLDNQCPVCKTLLNAENTNDLSNDLRFDIEIGKLLMTCPNKFCDIKMCIAELSQHINACTNTGIKCTLVTLGCDSVVASNREMKQHLSSELMKHFGLLVADLDKFRNENQIKIKNLSEGVAELTRENRRFKEEMRAVKREYVEIKKTTTDLREEIEKIAAGNRETKAGMNNKMAKLNQKNETIESKRKDMRHESRARTEGACANSTETVQQELGLPGAVYGLMYYKYTFTEIEKLRRDGDYASNEFYIDEYKFEIRMMRSSGVLYFDVNLLKGNFDSKLTWPLWRPMKLIFLDSNDSYKVLLQYEFSIDTAEDRFKSNYNKPTRDRNWLFTIKKYQREVVRKNSVTVKLEI